MLQAAVESAVASNAPINFTAAGEDAAVRSAINANFGHLLIPVVNQTNGWVEGEGAARTSQQRKSVVRLPQTFTRSINYRATLAPLSWLGITTVLEFSGSFCSFFWGYWFYGALTRIMGMARPLGNGTVGLTVSDNW